MEDELRAKIKIIVQNWSSKENIEFQPQEFVFDVKVGGVIKCCELDDGVLIEPIKVCEILPECLKIKTSGLVKKNKDGKINLSVDSKEMTTEIEKSATIELASQSTDSGTTYKIKYL